MQGLRKRWKLAQAEGAAGPGPGPLVHRVLAARGIRGPSEVERFCNPRLTHLLDPAGLPQVDRAAERIIQALRCDQKIVIYGDYDVDGVTGTAILYHVMKALRPQARIDTYVPHRLDEGYGINTAALRGLRAAGADLVISVDCGITALEPARAAREMGLDLIITDHHNLPDPPEHLPDALAIVHPRLPGSAYGFGALCGAGVAFKLAWRMATTWCGSQRVGEALQTTLLSMLPLVALGTIADVAPLVGENRVLAAHGLRAIKATTMPGLRALIEASGLMDEKIDAERVGFVLAPRLNACGRMGHAADAMRLLTQARPEEAAAIAADLCRLNRERQETERAIVDEAVKLAEAAGMTAPGCRAIVLAHEGWHAGVLGIVCSRLVDRFNRPTILMQREGGRCHGSARSIEGFSMYQALRACSGLLSTFGGHDAAAGLSLDAGKLEEFTRAMLAHASRSIAEEHLRGVLHVDCDAESAELDPATVSALSRLGPFGEANPAPTLRLRGLRVMAPPQAMGAAGKHLALRLGPPAGQQAEVLRSVWWNAGDVAERLAPGMRLDAVVEPKLNQYAGRVSVEPEIKDVRLIAG
jgi:single-stranded-DNA-specific exonuclease